ncbi:MAG: YbaN family protein [Planctomycetaceae bacterium]|nr:YbaN family protein [Planctomycetaceae bacterium]
MWRRAVCLLLAGFFFSLGALGVILPGLPTTPFLLLTSYFLARSSPRWHAALLRSRWFGPVLRDWQEQGGVRPGVKLWATGVVVLAVSAMLVFSSFPLPARAGAALLAGVGLVVVWRLPKASNPANSVVLDQNCLSAVDSSPVADCSALMDHDTLVDCSPVTSESGSRTTV